MSKESYDRRAIQLCFLNNFTLGQLFPAKCETIENVHGAVEGLNKIDRVPLVAIFHLPISVFENGFRIPRSAIENR